MKNRDGSDSNVKFVSESTKKKTNKKGNPPEPKLAKRTPLATALANSARKVKGLNKLSDSDISRQFSIARGMVKKTNPVAKGFAQDKRIRADKAKEKKAFSK